MAEKLRTASRSSLGLGLTGQKTYLIASKGRGEVVEVWVLAGSERRPFHNQLEVRVAENESSKGVGSDKRKQSLYFPESMLQEIKDEAARLDRSLSWVVQRAWKMARLEIKKIPSVNDVEDESEEAS
jgi:uncharacterized small protein (TIGR04563 family)